MTIMMTSSSHPSPTKSFKIDESNNTFTRSASSFCVNSKWFRMSSLNSSRFTLETTKCSVGSEMPLPSCTSARTPATSPAWHSFSISSSSSATEGLVRIRALMFLMFSRMASDSEVWSSFISFWCFFCVFNVIREFLCFYWKFKDF